jgi:hypothetical protein
MSPEEAFAQWRAYASPGSSAAACQWSRLTEALGRLVLCNSRGLHGRVVLARLNDLDGIVSDLRAALDSGGEEAAPREGEPLEPRANLLWAHLKPEIAFLQGSLSDHFRHVDRPLLERTIERYMRSDWLANDVLEWMMADASVYHDVVSFGLSIKRTVKGLNEALHAAETGAKTGRVALQAVGEFSAFVAAPIAIAAVAARHITDRFVLWVPPAALACVAVYAIVAIVRMTRRKRQKELIAESLAQWSAMSAAYRSLEGPVVSIARIEQLLGEAAARGAKWSRHIFALLDYAKARGVGEWKV